MLMQRAVKPSPSVVAIKNNNGSDTSKIGTDAKGEESIAIGGDVLASGDASIAIGSDDLHLLDKNGGHKHKSGPIDTLIKTIKY